MNGIEDTVAQKLVGWYRQGHRDLPWRNTKNAYHIWLSEIMLQQTQVATVLPYYDRFLNKYPTLQDLASAPIDDVLKQWEGLGYYARGRNLHKAAQKMVSDHGGVFPEAFEDIHALPGIGQSTAGAISTFALAKPYPILDGNVKRVLSRLYGVDQPVQQASVTELLWGKSSALLPTDPTDAYDFNQAIMELGATLCTPKKPECGRCPWQTDCVAYRDNLQHDLPVKLPPKKTPHHTIGVGVVWKDNTVLIALRPAEGLLGGLWEFPGGKCEEGESPKDCIQRELLEETGLEVSVGGKIETVKHAYTHFKITLHAFHCEVISGEPVPKCSQQLKWVTLDEIDQYAFPKANKTVLAALKALPAKQLTLY